VKTLDQIVDLLNTHHQRATYGAVAALLGKTPRSLMQGCRKDWRHSWVVNKGTGLPGEYPKGMIHPAIDARDEVLDSEEVLHEWLQDPTKQ
jgi:hypothetical protein